MHPVFIHLHNIRLKDHRTVFGLRRRLWVTGRFTKTMFAKGDGNVGGDARDAFLCESDKVDVKTKEVGPQRTEWDTGIIISKRHCKKCLCQHQLFKICIMSCFINSFLNVYQPIRTIYLMVGQKSSPSEHPCNPERLVFTWKTKLSHWIYPVSHLSTFWSSVCCFATAQHVGCPVCNYGDAHVFSSRPSWLSVPWVPFIYTGIVYPWGFLWGFRFLVQRCLVPSPTNRLGAEHPR